MKLVKTILAAGALSAAFAGGYGMAGCGIGALVLGDQPGKIQIVAATLNNIIIPQTSAITTGTSNCTEDGVTLQSHEQDYFAEANFELLKLESAQGRGENLDAFAALFGCSANGTAQFSASMQKNYNQIFSDAQNGMEMLSGVRSVVAPELAASCSAL
jgi:hypothetical protein